MRVHINVAFASLIIVGGVIVWHVAPTGGPVTIDFVRYERAGSDWHAYMEIQNNTSRPVSYRSAGITSTHYVWDSPQIDYAWRLQSPETILPSKSNAIFRVLVMTTEHDWRVGIDYEIGPPTWSASVPAWLLNRARRVGIVTWGEQRAWSPQVKKPKFDVTPYESASASHSSAGPSDVSRSIAHD